MKEKLREITKNKSKAKALLIIMLVIVILAGLIGGIYFSYENKSSEDNFIWNNNKIVSLSDEGKKLTKIVIPARCEGFENSLFIFDGCKTKEVSFESDKDISLDEAFTGANSLEKVELPQELTVIPQLCFYGCSSIKKVDIPDSVVSIGAYAFAKCTSLKNITMGENTKMIMSRAFEECTSLKEVELNNVEYIDQYVFSKCSSLKTITLTESVKQIGSYVFNESALKKIIVDENVELTSYASTSFENAESKLSVKVKKDSWVDKNFEKIFPESAMKS